MASSVKTDPAAYWKQLKISNYPNVHPEDIPFLKAYCPGDLHHRELDAISYTEEEAAHTLPNFHFSLTPVPYIGNLQTADIFVLMLNPGFSGKEYEIEARPEFQSALSANLYQNLNEAKSPFWYLDERYKSHPGHGYWSGRLRGIANDADCTPNIAQRLAVLQLVPYHSANFNLHKMARDLPSANLICNYVHRTIVPKAKRGEILLIVARQVSNWGFSTGDESANIIVYKAAESRSAWLTPNTRGGKAIVERCRKTKK